MASCGTVYQVPGPRGEAGADGADGTDGVNAFTTLSASFSMPAVAATASGTVEDASWIVPGQILFIQVAGYMQVDGKAGNVLTLNNLGYDANAAAATTIPSSGIVSPGGEKGADGSLTGTAGGDLEGTYPNPTIAVLTAKGDLLAGNGSASAPKAARLAAGTDGQLLHYDSAQSLGMIGKDLDLTGTNTSLSGALPIANGGTGQTGATAAFDALGPGTTKGDIIVHNGTDHIRVAVGSNNQILTADSAQPSGVKWADGGALSTLKYGLLGSLTSADFNVTTDQAITINSTNYIVRRIVVHNADTNMTTAQGGIYTATSKGGTVIVNSTQVYTALTAAGKFVDLTLAATPGTDLITASTLYFSLTTAQGAAATADIYIFGETFS